MDDNENKIKGDLNVISYQSHLALNENNFSMEKAFDNEISYCSCISIVNGIK